MLVRIQIMNSKAANLFSAFGLNSWLNQLLKVIMT
jgi:hypothetical protein